jgi:hypothetical protein
VDFAIAAAIAVAEAQVRATTSAPGDAVDSADPRDCLAPDAWTLTAASGAAPQVRRVVPDEPTIPPSAFLLELDAPLTPGASYSLALAPLARSAHGEPTSTAAVTFVGRTPRARVGDVPGAPAADVALPVTASGGEPRGLAPLEALKTRIRLAVSARQGAFTHAPQFGRGVEPKHTYSTAKIAQVARSLADSLRADPDIRRAEVSGVSEGHAARFDIVVETTAGAPISITERITAGGDP